MSAPPANRSCYTCKEYKSNQQFAISGTTTLAGDCLSCRRERHESPEHGPVVSPMARPIRWLRCTNCRVKKRETYFNVIEVSDTRSPQFNDVCALCERNAESESADVAGLHEEMLANTEGRGSGTRTRGSGVEDREEEEEGHTCPRCRFRKPEHKFTALSPQCSDCRKRDLEAKTGDKGGNAPRKGEPPQERRGFESTRCRKLRQELAAGYRGERESDGEDEGDASPEFARHDSEAAHRAQSESRESSPPSSLPGTWRPRPVLTPWSTLPLGIPSCTTISIQSSARWFEETVAAIKRNRPLAEEFRITLAPAVPKPRHEEMIRDLPDFIYLIPSLDENTLDHREMCDETGMEQTAFGQYYFHEDRCRRMLVDRDHWNGNELNKERRLRWIGYCDWRGVSQIQGSDLPHHRIQAGTRNAGVDGVNVGKPNDYLICDACRTSAHSRMYWFEFPNVSVDNSSIPELLQHRRDDIEVRPQSQPPRSRNSAWRHWIQHSWLPVCAKCDAQQKRLHPRGHDGCVCYQRRYLDNWLCQRCDAENLRQYIEVTRELKLEDNMRTHAIPGDTGGGGLKPGLKPKKQRRRCPCGKLPVLRDTKTTMEKCQMVKRCGQCLEFIVPGEFDPPAEMVERVMKRRRANRSPSQGLQMLNERGKTVDQPIFV